MHNISVHYIKSTVYLYSYCILFINIPYLLFNMIYLVTQGDSYKEEFNGSFIWSPQRQKDKVENGIFKEGRANAGFTAMKHVRKGDFLLHASNSKIVAIGVAKSDCRNAVCPQSIYNPVRYNKDGYMVDVDYHPLEVPVSLINCRPWIADHPKEKSAFIQSHKSKPNLIGSVKELYLNSIAYEHAAYIIEKAIQTQASDGIIRVLKDALLELKEEYNVDSPSQEIVNNIIGDTANTPWEAIEEDAHISTTAETHREIVDRDPQKASNALAKAGHKCEIDSSHITFIRKGESGVQYMEPHHLIPLSKFRDFIYTKPDGTKAYKNLDMMVNIVSLCPTCHRHLHYGPLNDEKKRILKALYDKRIGSLRKVGLDLSLEQLFTYYE